MIDLINETFNLSINPASFIAIKIALTLIFAPLAGGLLSGLDRIITAKMQRRRGPSIFQPFYDVKKLLQKSETIVNPFSKFFVMLSLTFNAFTVVLFFLGMDLLLCVFAFTLACIFFVIAGYSSFSPYSFIGTERELLQIMCYEPMVLITAFGYYQAAGSFNISRVFELEAPIIIKLPFIFLGLLYVLTIKLRKSPFDLSMSHHGHQEIVKGITTEFTGACLAFVEISHWFEVVFALGLVFLFVAYSSWVSWLVALGICFLAYFLEIIIDNTFARAKWKPAIAASWAVTGIAGGINLLLLGL